MLDVVLHATHGCFDDVHALVDRPAELLADFILSHVCMGLGVDE